MIIRQDLTRSQAERAMDEGEFDESVTAAAPRVAVVLSQDWCGQWTAMDRYLSELSAAGGEPRGEGQGSGEQIVVFHLVYNTVEYFHAFMGFKETVWRNALIPYVRYYRNGRLVGQSNYVSQNQFLALLEP